MKANEIVNINKIVYKMLNQDLEKIKNSQIYEIDNISFLQLKDSILTNDINNILYIVENLIHEEESKQNEEAVIFLFHYLYRNIYLMRILTDWEKFNEIINEDVVISDVGEMFLKYLAPFFDVHISIFSNNYLNYVMGMKLKNNNKEHFKELDTYISNILKYDDFHLRLDNAEKLVKFLENNHNLNVLINDIDVSERNNFCLLTTELKVDFQTMNNFVVEAISTLKELRVN